MNNIYKSQTWKKIDIVVRIYLIPVIEKIRPGGVLELPLRCIRVKKCTTIVDKKQKRLIMRCLKEIGLKFAEYDGSFFVSWEESVLSKLWENEISIGEFLGYPKCCSEAFYEGCKKFLKNEGKGPAQIFWKKQKLAEEAGSYNEDLDFVFHVPCELECKETMEMASKIRKSLETCDPEAAHYFQKIHRSCRS